MIIYTLNQFGIYDFYPATWLNSNFVKILCTTIHDLCNVLAMITSDQNPQLNNETASKVYFSHFPSGSSLKEVDHFN